jgi:hypothetical protein
MHMSDGNAFAKEFVELLKKSKFPSDLPAADILQQTHAVFYAHLTAVAGKFGQQLSISDLMQGGSGGGVPHGPHGPHRLDLILRYLTDVDPKTMTTTLQILK